jgi:hypothetical protein
MPCLRRSARIFAAAAFLFFARTLALVLRLRFGAARFFFLLTDALRFVPRLFFARFLFFFAAMVSKPFPQ